MQTFMSTFSCQTFNSFTIEILWTFLRSQSKSDLNKNHLSMFTASFPLIYSQHLTILGLCYCKKKLTQVVLQPL